MTLDVTDRRRHGAERVREGAADEDEIAEGRQVGNFAERHSQRRRERRVRLVIRRAEIDNQVGLFRRRLEGLQQGVEIYAEAGFHYVLDAGADADALLVGGDDGRDLRHDLWRAIQRCDRHRIRLEFADFVEDEGEHGSAVRHEFGLDLRVGVDPPFARLPLFLVALRKRTDVFVDRPLRRAVLEVEFKVGDRDERHHRIFGIVRQRRQGLALGQPPPQARYIKRVISCHRWPPVVYARRLGRPTGSATCSHSVPFECAQR